MTKDSILITGATSPLGQSLATHFLADGMRRIFLTSRSKHDVDLLDDSRITYLPGIDLTRESDLEKLASAVDGFLPGRFSVLNAVGY